MHGEVRILSIDTRCEGGFSGENVTKRKARLGFICVRSRDSLDQWFEQTILFVALFRTGAITESVYHHYF